MVEGKSADDLVRLYGGDPTQSIGSLTYDDATVPHEDFGKYFHLQIRACGPYVVAIENNGWTGNLPEIARRASVDDGRFFSVYWSPSASGILEAVNGAVTAYFDPVLFDPGSKFDVYPAWAHESEMEIRILRAVSLAYMERQSGLEFDRTWLGEKLPTYRIPDPDLMLNGVDGARLPWPLQRRMTTGRCRYSSGARRQNGGAVLRCTCPSGDGLSRVSAARSTQTAAFGWPDCAHHQ